VIVDVNDSLALDKTRGMAVLVDVFLSNSMDFDTPS
jgi:hypothetical protein